MSSSSRPIQPRQTMPNLRDLVVFFPAETPLYILKHLVEREALKFRAYLGYDECEPVNATDIAEMIGLDVRFPGSLSHLSASVQRTLVTRDRDAWSGLTLYLPNGEIV